jgi:hypothetical protein
VLTSTPGVNVCQIAIVDEANNGSGSQPVMPESGKRFPVEPRKPR